MINYISNWEFERFLGTDTRCCNESDTVCVLP